MFSRYTFLLSPPSPPTMPPRPNTGAGPMFSVSNSGAFTLLSTLEIFLLCISRALSLSHSTHSLSHPAEFQVNNLRVAITCKYARTLCILYLSLSLSLSLSFFLSLSPPTQHSLFLTCTSICFLSLLFANFCSTLRQAHAHTNKSTQIRTRARTHTHTQAHAHTHTHAHTCTYTRTAATPTHAHTFAHGMRPHTHIHARTCTHTHVFSLPPELPSPPSLFLFPFLSFVRSFFVFLNLACTHSPSFV